MRVMGAQRTGRGHAHDGRPTRERLVMHMTAAMRMEWTKLRTVRATGWSLLTLFLSTVALSALAAAQTGPADCAPRPCTLDTTKIALTGVYIGQIAVVAFSVLAITSEYDTMTIRATLAAMPRRTLILAAKAIVVTTTVLVTAASTVLGCLTLVRVILVRKGFNELNGYQRMLMISDGQTRRAFLGTIFYLCAVSVLSLGMAVVIRHTAGAITTMVALLYVPVIVVRFVTDPDWQHRIATYSPMTASRAMLAVYAAVAMLVGAAVLDRRDA